MHDVLKTPIILRHKHISFMFIYFFVVEKDNMIFVKYSYWLFMTQKKATVCEQSCTYIININIIRKVLVVLKDLNKYELSEFI